MSIVNALALAGLLAAVAANVPMSAVLVMAAFIGASSPQIGPMGRARWMGLFAARGGKSKSLATAMGWESMTDEVSFIVGPLLVASITTLINPAAPLVVAAVMVLLFALGFAMHPTHAHAPRIEPGATRVGRLLSGQLVMVIAGMTVMGMFWGCDAHHRHRACRRRRARRGCGVYLRSDGGERSCHRFDLRGVTAEGDLGVEVDRRRSNCCCVRSPAHRRKRPGPGWDVFTSRSAWVLARC